MAENITKILVVDDHPIVRQGVRMLVEAEGDLKVCAEAADAAGAMQALRVHRPDVAVVDLSLEGSSGLELIRDMTSRRPDLLVLVLSMRDETFYVERALRAGARGYITKDQGTDKVVEGIRGVLSGKVYLSEDLAGKMISLIMHEAPGSEGGVEGLLTNRELEVFEMIGNGLTTRQIAAKLNLSVKTIESHRANIKEKLGIVNATELIKYAVEWLQSQRGGEL